MNVVPTVPIQPIIEWWARHQPPHQRSNCVCTIGGQCGSVESLARTVSVSHSTMYRRLRVGVLTEPEADQWAVAIAGVHPLAIWPRYDRLPTCKGADCDA